VHFVAQKSRMRLNLVRPANTETQAMWAWSVLFVALMLLAGRMARFRHRSTKAWVWITAVVGPIGPLPLLILGEASHA
jgi:hypothetical protein